MTNREPEYYDYGHGETTESYESYGKEQFFYYNKRQTSLLNWSSVYLLLRVGVWNMHARQPIMSLIVFKNSKKKNKKKIISQIKFSKMCIFSANIDFIDWYHCQLIEWHWYWDLSASVPLCHIIFCCLNVKHVVMKAEKDKAIRKTLALPDGYFKDLKLDKISQNWSSTMWWDSSSPWSKLTAVFHS